MSVAPFLIGTKYPNVRGLSKAGQSVGTLMIVSAHLLKRNPAFQKLLKSVVAEGYKLRTEVT